MSRIAVPALLTHKRTVAGFRALILEPMSKKINVAIVGLGFGAEFIPLWQKHPHANCYAICQRNEDKLNAVGDYFGVDVRHQHDSQGEAEP